MQILGRWSNTGTKPSRSKGMNFLQGELVWVQLNPAQGQETRERHLCLVLNRPFSGSSVRLVVPMLRWKPFYERNRHYFVKIDPNPDNNLNAERTPDISQIRAIDLAEPGRVDHGWSPIKGAIAPDQLKAVRNAISLFLS
jgi:mRNA-degrading endonuclease toxin of MazEF toxin-antitoxin module